MSDTPRTDAEALKSRPPFNLVTRKFAEELERECNQRKADWNKACDEQLILMLEIEGHRERATKLREALQSVMGWNPKPEPTDRPQTVARFEADMAKAREVLEETE